MQPSRRKFFGVFATGAVAAPIAVKAAADEVIAKAAGINGASLGGAGQYINGGLSNSVSGIKQGGPWVSHEERVAKALKHVKLFGVPDVVDFEMRERARRVETLDPDIACKRSWSMSVKIQTQRERNYQRQLEHGERTVWHSEKRELLQKLLGFEWPW